MYRYVGEKQISSDGEMREGGAQRIHVRAAAQLISGDTGNRLLVTEYTEQDTGHSRDRGSALLVKGHRTYI